MRSPAPDFDKLTIPSAPRTSSLAMTQYDKNWPWAQIRNRPKNSSIFSRRFFADIQYKNLRCAETEKYAHVTYFSMAAWKSHLRAKNESRPFAESRTYD